MDEKPWKYYIVLTKFGNKSAQRSAFDFQSSIRAVTQFESVLRGIKDLYFRRSIHSDDGCTVLFLVQSRHDARMLEELLDQFDKMRAFRTDDYEAPKNPAFKAGDILFIGEVGKDYVTREFTEASYWFGQAESLPELL